MKHTIEGIGKIEIINGVLFINDKTLSQIFEEAGMDNMSLLGGHPAIQDPDQNQRSPGAARVG